MSKVIEVAINSTIPKPYIYHDAQKTVGKEDMKIQISIEFFDIKDPKQSLTILRSIDKFQSVGKKVSPVGVHELLHGLGFAMACTKGVTRGKHLDTGILGPDLKKSLGKAIYGHGDPTCPDLKDSVYLTPTSDDPYDPLAIQCALAQKVRGYPPGKFEIPSRYTNKKLLKGRNDEWCTFGVYPNAKEEWFKDWKK